MWPCMWLVTWHTSLHVEHVTAYWTGPRLNLARHSLEHLETFYRSHAQTRTQNSPWARPNQSPKEGIVLLANDCTIQLQNHAINCRVIWSTVKLHNPLMWPYLIVLFLDIWTKVIQTPHVYTATPLGLSCWHTSLMYLYSALYDSCELLMCTTGSLDAHTGHFHNLDTYSGSKNCPNVWLFWKDWTRINWNN